MRWWAQARFDAQQAAAAGARGQGGARGPASLEVDLTGRWFLSLLAD